MPIKSLRITGNTAEKDRQNLGTGYSSGKENKMKRSLVLLGMLTLVCTAPVHASVEKGDVEVDFNVSYSDRSSATSNPDKEMFSAEIGIDRFITHTIQVGAFVDAAWTDQGSLLEAEDLGLGARARLHFNPSNANIP